MDEPDKQDQGRDSFINKMKEKARLSGDIHFIRGHVPEVLSGILVFVGLVLAFFYIHLGAMLVGLGFGICFYQELYNYFLQIRESYSRQRLFKILVGLATILFLLLSIPAFIIATAIGFGVIYLVRTVFKK